MDFFFSFALPPVSFFNTHAPSFKRAAEPHFNENIFQSLDCRGRSEIDGFVFLFQVFQSKDLMIHYHSQHGFSFFGRISDSFMTLGQWPQRYQTPLL